MEDVSHLVNTFGIRTILDLRSESEAKMKRLEMDGVQEDEVVHVDSHYRISEVITPSIFSKLKRKEYFVEETKDTIRIERK